MSHPSLHLKSNLTSGLSSFPQKALFLFLDWMYCSMESPWSIFHWLQHQILKLLYRNGHFLCICIVWSSLCYVNLSLIIVCICPSFINTPQKKLPLTSLSQAMVEGGNQLGEDSLIGWVCVWLTGQITNYSSWATVANGADAPQRVWNMRTFIQGKQSAQFGFLLTGLCVVPFYETQIIHCA